MKDLNKFIELAEDTEDKIEYALYELHEAIKINKKIIKELERKVKNG